MSVTGTGQPSVADLLHRAVRSLLSAGVPDAALDAEWLLADELGTDRSGLYLRRGEPVPDESRARFLAQIDLRSQRIPLQHLLRCQEFYGRRFAVNASVLIPRGDSERLIDVALELQLADGARVEDWGTGSGCLAITLQLERPTWKIGAVELSQPALQVAQDNAIAHGVAEGISFSQRSFADIDGLTGGELDLIVCNPPYIAESEWEELQPEVKEHDPKLALVPGATGLESYRDLLPAASFRLREQGRLLLELGHGQHVVVAPLARSVGFSQIELRNDLAGVPRVLHLQKSPSSENPA